jgi:nicotinamidase-related amidase
LNSAILIIDVQKGMFSMDPPVYNGELLLDKLTQMISFAYQHNIPLIYVQHNGPENSPLEKHTTGWDIHDAIAPQDNDIILQKNTPDSFYETNLKSYLDKLNIDHLILTGIQTEACVDSTCRRAFSLNYDVTLITDAHSTFDKEEITAQQIINHHNEVLRWFSNTETLDEYITNNAS